MTMTMTKPMRLLIADAFPEAFLSEFRSLGLSVECRPELDEAGLTSAVAGVGILVVRSKKVSRATIEAGRELELILRAGAGVDTIDVAAASERGVYVANCAGKNSVAVAELTWGLILAADRRIPQATSELRAGSWNKKEYSKALGLKGRSLGVVGLGSIGQAVAKRAAAFEMDVWVLTVPPNPEAVAAVGAKACASLGELAERCDVVTVHVPNTPATAKLFNADFFGRMKRGALFVNTSRGAVVDTAALLQAMKERDLRVALDVYESEPAGGTGVFQSPLTGLPGFIGTHHIGASTEQAQNAIASEAVRICREYVKAGRVPSCVNIELHAPATVQLIVRHYDKVGVLAEVLDLIRRQGINVEDMSNTIFSGAKAAVAVIRMAAAPTEELMASLRSMPDKVIQVSAKAC